MLGRVTRLSFLLVFALLTSCEDDPLLVEENERLIQEISVLELELAEARQKLKSQPGDVSGELRESKRLLKRMEEEALKLETELVGLRETKDSAERKLRDYKQKYPVE